MRCRYWGKTAVACQCKDENCVDKEFRQEGIKPIVKLHRVYSPKCLLVLFCCFIYFCNEVLGLLFSQRNTAPAVSGRLLAMEATVESQTSPCGVFGGHSGTKTCF